MLPMSDCGHACIYHAIPACCTEYKPDLRPVCKYNLSALNYAANRFGLEGVKLLMQAGCPLPEDGVQSVVTSLKLHSSLAKTSVGVPNCILRDAYLLCIFSLQ
jgi:hypothetical protein